MRCVAKAPVASHRPGPAEAYGPGSGINMGVLDAPLAKVAQTLTKQFGRSATLRRSGTGNFNPATGNIEATGDATDATCEVVFAEFSQNLIAQGLVQEGDRRAIVSRLRIEGTLSASEPVPGRDVLIEGGRTWQIVSVQGYSSGENEAAYELHLRR